MRPKAGTGRVLRRGRVASTRPEAAHIWKVEKNLPLPLREGAVGRGSGQYPCLKPLPPVPFRKGRGTCVSRRNLLTDTVFALSRSDHRQPLVTGRRAIATAPLDAWQAYTVIGCEARPSTTWPRSTPQVVEGRPVPAMTRRAPFSVPDSAVIIAHRRVTPSQVRAGR